MNNCWLNFWLLALELYLGAKSESGSLIYGWQNRGSGNEWAEAKTSVYQRQKILTSCIGLFSHHPWELAWGEMKTIMKSQVIF